MLAKAYVYKSYSMVVLYHTVCVLGGSGFLAKNITKKPASQYYPGTLAVLVRYNQA